MAYNTDPYLLREKEEACKRGVVAATMWLAQHYYWDKDYHTALEYFKKIQFQDKEAYRMVNVINRILEEEKGYETPSYDTDDWDY